MDDTALLVESLIALLEDHCDNEVVTAAEDSWCPDLWRQLDIVGATTLGVPESLGGAGGGIGDVVAAVRTAARFAAPIPLAETLLLANPILAASGLEWRPGPSTVASPAAERLQLRRVGGGWTLEGVARRVPFARASGRVLVPIRTENGWRVASVAPAQAQLIPGRNLAREPRDDLRFAAVELSDDEVGEMSAEPDNDPWLLGALSRVVLSAGALERVLDLTCRYALEREQFGRPIARFQAVKQLVAQLAGEVAAGVAAAESAAAARGGELQFQISAAKVRSARAATRASEIAHQVHGALGFTREYPLQQYTRRLWSWRDEYGPEGEWERSLGRSVLGGGADGLWPLLVGS